MPVRTKCSHRLTFENKTHILKTGHAYAYGINYEFTFLLCFYQIIIMGLAGPNIASLAMMGYMGGFSVKMQPIRLD